MYVISISVDKRKKTIPLLQDVLSSYGDKINTRLGIHDCKNENTGIIIAIYDGEDVEEFVEKLNTVENTEVNYHQI